MAPPDYTPLRRATDAVCPPGICHQADDIAEDAADKAVKKVFAILGVNIDEPKEVEEFREDLRFGRRLRRVADHGMMAFWGAIFVALGAAMWVGITNNLGKH